MKFKLRTVETHYSLEEKIVLEKYGFTFEKAGDNTYYKENTEVEVNLDTIEDLLEFQNDVGDIVLWQDNTIIVYDGYLE